MLQVIVRWNVETKLGSVPILGSLPILRLAGSGEVSKAAGAERPPIVGLVREQALAERQKQPPGRRLCPRCWSARVGEHPFLANGSDAVLREFAVARHDRKTIGERSGNYDSVGGVFVEAFSHST